MIRRFIAAAVPAALAALTLASSAASGAAPVPSSALLLYGNESAASPDGPAALLFNPGAAGLRYPSEFAITMLDPRTGSESYRGVVTYGGLTFAGAGGQHRRTMPGLGVAGGSGALRYGAMTTWIPRDAGGRATDYRVGALSRPTPWLSIGVVADHANRPRLAGTRLKRDYTVGVAVRPRALARAKAGSSGPQLTLTCDALFRGGWDLGDAEYRIGAALEPAPGLSLRGIYLVESQGFQLGISLLGLRTGYHVQSGYDAGGAPRFATYSASFHEGEDRTVLLPRTQRRVAVPRVGDDRTLADRFTRACPSPGATPRWMRDGATPE